MSNISGIFESYRKALDRTYEEQAKLWAEIRNRIKPFYESFLKDLIIDYGDFIKDEHRSALVRKSIEDIFGTSDIKFVAIDGSSFKEEFSEFIVFYGGAYAVRGTLKLKENPVRIEYEKWDIKHDKSVVAYIPVPYIDLKLEEDLDMFFATDKEKAEFASIHNQIMQLAEIYLAYTFVRSPDTDVNLILMDNSLSSIYLSNDVLYKLYENELRVVNYRFNKNLVTPADIYIAYAMPVNDRLDVPSCKNFHGEFYLIRKLFDKMEFENDCNYIKDGKHIHNLRNLGILSEDSDSKNLRVNTDIMRSTRESWEFMKDLFEYICEELFVRRNLSVLKVDRESKQEWLTSYDIRLLISIGIRMLIEKCWERNVMLLGIAKDSSSNYFIKNYLGVLHYMDIYDFDPPRIYVSDRLLLETIPFIDTNIKAPWSTVEFDSVFMSLHLNKDEKGNILIEGFRGNVIVPHERLFLRSLAQFYVNRSKRYPRTGNVIFIDRIAHPEHDSGYRLSKRGGRSIVTSRGDSVDPLFFCNNSENNKMQQALIYLIDTLTKNLFPHVIGYPDPLHKADWGAKSMNKKIRELIKSSEIKFAADPLKRSLRDKREEGYRRW